jgi:integrase
MTRQLHSELKLHITNFIDYKHSCHLKYKKASDVLYQFDQYCYEHQYLKDTLDREITMSFLRKKENERMTNVSNKASTLRQFGYYLRDVCKIDTTFIVPSISLRGHSSFIPYVFSDNEVKKIIYHAQNYTSHTPVVLPNIRNAISAMITLLYCTGMRAGEVTYLKIQEVDLEKQLLYINTAKNDNKRIVTLSDSMTKELQRYQKESKQHKLSNMYFFDAGASRNDGYIAIDTLYHYFREILKKSGIQHLGKGNGPRMHDLRTTFCCHSLKKLTTMDIDVNAYIVYLSTYLGHKSLRETQDYIWLTAELYEDTRVQLENYTSFVSDIFHKGVDHEESL